MSEFQLDSRLQADTLFISDLKLSRCLLMNDRRWPWLILVPRISEAVEIHDLGENEQQNLAHECAFAAKIMKDVTQCRKINSGSLGNMVEQLHVHVVARNEGDPNWPGPVWGFEKRIPYIDGQASSLVGQLRVSLADLD